MNRNAMRDRARFASPDGRAGGGRERQRNRADGGGSGGGGRKRNWFARHKIITIVVSVVVLAAAFAIGYVYYIKNNLTSVLQNRTPAPTVEETSEEPETTAPDGSSTGTDTATVEPTPTDPTTNVVLADTVNILVLGTDADTARMTSGRNTTLTDCVMVVSINTKTKKASIISIPRDTYVKIYNDKNKLTKTRNRINAAFGAGGGMRSVDKALLYAQNTVNQFLAKGKIPIDHHVLFNMDFVCNLIDAVGGVNVPVNNLKDDTQVISGDHGTFTYKNGTTMKMNGNMALTYARDRHHTKGGDQGRVKHQQDVIIALLKDLKSGGNLVRMIPQLFQEFQKDIYTDIKSLDLIIAFALLARDMNLDDIQQYVVQGDYFGLDNASLLVAYQQDKADIVQKVFGISGAADNSWTKAKLQAEINAKLQAGKAIVTTAKNFLSSNADYYSSAEAQDLRDAINDWQTAVNKNDTDGAADAQQLVQSAYEELKTTVVEPRKDLIDAGKTAISSVSAELNDKRGWMTDGQISDINAKIAAVQTCVDNKDYTNVVAATTELKNTAADIFKDVSPTSTPSPS